MLDKAVIEPSREEDEFVPLLELLQQQKLELAAIHDSTSWRWTSPIRRFLDFLRGRSNGS